MDEHNFQQLLIEHSQLRAVDTINYALRAKEQMLNDLFISPYILFNDGRRTEKGVLINYSLQLHGRVGFGLGYLFVGLINLQLDLPLQSY